MITKLTKKIKLSKAQRDVINTLRNGQKLHWITGLHARCFFDNWKGNISWSTIFKLEKLGLISRKDGEKYIHLTELGKTIEL